MARTMSREEVSRIAWRVSMSGLKRAAHEFGRSVPTPSLLRGPTGRGWRPRSDPGRRREASLDRAIAADERGGESGRHALDVRGPADRQPGAAGAVELRGEDTVQRGLEGERPLLAATREATAQVPERRLVPWLEDVLFDGGESCWVRGEHRVVAPWGLRQAELRLVEMHERLREGLTGILKIVRALVTGEGSAGDLLLADALVGRPALGAVVERGPRVVEPVVGDVVSVLVRDDLFDGAPGRVLADRNDLAGGGEIATVGLVAVAEDSDLGRRSEVDVDGGDLLAVHEAVDEVGRSLVHRFVDGVFPD